MNNCNHAKIKPWLKGLVMVDTLMHKTLLQPFSIATQTSPVSHGTAGNGTLPCCQEQARTTREVQL